MMSLLLKEVTNHSPKMESHKIPQKPPFCTYTVQIVPTRYRGVFVPSRSRNRGGPATISPGRENPCFWSPHPQNVASQSIYKKPTGGKPKWGGEGGSPLFLGFFHQFNRGIFGFLGVFGGFWGFLGGRVNSGVPGKTQFSGECRKTQIKKYPPRGPPVIRPLSPTG